MSKLPMSPEQKIEAFVGKTPGVSRADIAKEIKIEATKLSVILGKMVRGGVLVMTGRTRAARYSKSPKAKSAA